MKNTPNYLKKEEKLSFLDASQAKRAQSNIKALNGKKLSDMLIEEFKTESGIILYSKIKHSGNGIKRTERRYFIPQSMTGEQFNSWKKNAKNLL